MLRLWCAHCRSLRALSSVALGSLLFLFASLALNVQAENRATSGQPPEDPRSRLRSKIIDVLDRPVARASDMRWAVDKVVSDFANDHALVNRLVFLAVVNDDFWEDRGWVWIKKPQFDDPHTKVYRSQELKGLLTEGARKRYAVVHEDLTEQQRKTIWRRVKMIRQPLLNALQKIHPKDSGSLFILDVNEHYTGGPFADGTFPPTHIEHLLTEDRKAFDYDLFRPNRVNRLELELLLAAEDPDFIPMAERDLPEAFVEAGLTMIQNSVFAERFKPELSKLAVSDIYKQDAARQWWPELIQAQFPDIPVDASELVKVLPKIVPEIGNDPLKWNYILGILGSASFSQDQKLQAAKILEEPIVSIFSGDQLIHQAIAEKALNVVFKLNIHNIRIFDYVVQAALKSQSVTEQILRPGLQTQQLLKYVPEYLLDETKSPLAKAFLLDQLSEITLSRMAKEELRPSVVKTEKKILNEYISLDSTKWPDNYARVLVPVLKLIRKCQVEDDEIFLLCLELAKKASPPVFDMDRLQLELDQRLVAILTCSKARSFFSEQPEMRLELLDGAALEFLSPYDLLQIANTWDLKSPADQLALTGYLRRQIQFTLDSGDFDDERGNPFVFGAEILERVTANSRDSRVLEAVRDFVREVEANREGLRIPPDYSFRSGGSSFAGRLSRTLGDKGSKLWQSICARLIRKQGH